MSTKVWKKDGASLAGLLEGAVQTQIHLCSITELIRASATIPLPEWSTLPQEKIPKAPVG
jgi:hypothetical protein